MIHSLHSYQYCSEQAITPHRAHTHCGIRVFLNLSPPPSLLPSFPLGERRIRVHTLCLPVTSEPSILYSKFNIQAIVGVLANMGEGRGKEGGRKRGREGVRE